MKNSKNFWNVEVKVYNSSCVIHAVNLEHIQAQFIHQTSLKVYIHNIHVQYKHQFLVLRLWEVVGSGVLNWLVPDFIDEKATPRTRAMTVPP